MTTVMSVTSYLRVCLREGTEKASPFLSWVRLSNTVAVERPVCPVRTAWVEEPPAVLIPVTCAVPLAPVMVFCPKNPETVGLADRVHSLGLAAPESTTLASGTRAQ